MFHARAIQLDTTQHITINMGLQITAPAGLFGFMTDSRRGRMPAAFPFYGLKADDIYG